MYVPYNCKRTFKFWTSSGGRDTSDKAASGVIHALEKFAKDEEGEPIVVDEILATTIRRNIDMPSFSMMLAPGVKMKMKYGEGGSSYVRLTIKDNESVTFDDKA